MRMLKSLLTVLISLACTHLQAQPCNSLYGTITTFAGSAPGYSGDGGPSATAALNHPLGMCFDVAGNLYVADFSNHCIRKITSGTGVISTIAGTGTPGHSGDGGPATAASLNGPASVRFDGNGDLYISENIGHCIRKIDMSTGTISTIAGVGSPGYSGDGGPAVNAQLGTVAGICFDASGNLFLADASNHAIRKVDASTGIITTVAGNGTAGFTGDGGPATAARLNQPWDLCFDPSDNLIIADAANHRIRKITTAGIISTIAGTGNAGFSGDGGPATAAKLYGPGGLAVDPQGNLIFSEGSNQRIRKINAATGIISTVVGCGNSAVLGDGGPAVLAGLFGPSFLVFDGSGNLYIADTDHARIRKVTAAVVNVSSTQPTILTITPSICSGQTTVLNISSGNLNSADNWKWYTGSCGGTPIGSGPSITITPGTSTTYFVRGEGACVAPGNCETILINVSSAAPPSISINASPSGTICAGSLMTFTATAVNAGTQPLYQWKINGLPVGLNNPVFSSTSLNNNDVVTCTVTSNLVCASPQSATSAGITVSVIPSPSGTVLPPAAQICGGTQTFTVNGTGSIQWYVNGFPVAGATSNTYTSAQPGNYWVQLTGGNNCTALTNTAVLSIVSVPTGVISPASATICTGASQTLTVNGGTTYQWLLNGSPIPGATASTYPATISGTYTATIFNGSCAGSASNSAVITVSSTPAGVISPATATICKGGTQTLTATGGSSYQWSLNGSPIAGATASAYNASQAGVYSVNIINATCSGPAINTASLTVRPLPNAGISPLSSTICAGQQQTLTASGGISFQWNFEGNAIPGATSSTFHAGQAGHYSVSVSDGQCNATSADATLSFTTAQKNMYSIVRVAMNMPYNLQARPIGQNYVWSPATELSDATISNPVITATQDRLYTISISSSSGCPVVDTVFIQVFARPDIYVPSAFSPDGNGKNDLLRPIPVHIREISYFKVFNRWGQQVFQTARLDGGWNGSLNGKPQPAGVYVWLFEGKDTNGKVIRAQGQTVLIR